MGFWSRAIRPDPADEIPNANDPGANPPGSVGQPSYSSGDPDGLILAGPTVTAQSLPSVVPSAWSGWPDGWATPYWGNGNLQCLTDTAWMCLDLNASVLASMPPYLVGAPASLSSDWLNNPDPDVYASWEEFAKQLFWDYQLGEAFVLATSYYSTGWPARFHVVPPWFVNVELREGIRYYSIGEQDVTGEILHVRYQSSTGSAHGVGPLDAGSARCIADRVLTEYGTKLAVTGVPSGVLAFPNGISPEQAALAKAQWMAARVSSVGEPAVLSGGITWTPTQLDPTKLGLLDLLRFQQSRIAVLLGVPPVVVGLPSGGDSLTYSNVTMLFDFHWRAGLRPKAQSVMSALSGWALPRGTSVEVNRDAYIQPEPYERAQTAQILAGIVDPNTGQQALTVSEIRAAERLDDATPVNPAQGVLRG